MKLVRLCDERCKSIAESWLIAAVVFTLAGPCFGHCMCPFVLITCKVMGAKLDKVKNKQSKGQTEGKKLQ